MSKFEFTGETKLYMGRTLHRIRATETFALQSGITVNKGDTGGWVENESNLCGNAWIYGDAMVCDNARVCGDAMVCDNARVCGDALVYGDAFVSGDAVVCGFSWASGYVIVSGKARVLDRAWVSGNARVSGKARVFGNALVSGGALVCGNATVSGDAIVSGDAYISRPDHMMEIGEIGSRYDTTTFFRNKDGIIKVNCGCFYGSIDEFRDKVKLTHGENKFAKVYLAAADLAEMQIDVSAIKEEGDV